MWHSIRWFFAEYWAMVRPQTQLEIEMEEDKRFSRYTGWMRPGALERERQAAKNYKFR